MKNILKKHDISLRLLSLLLSVVLWAVVMDMDNPERPRTFDNIPVRISGATVLQQQTGLSLIEGADSTVKITLRGPSKTLGDIKASQIAASVDVSGLTEANEYDLPVSVTVSRSGLEVEYISPSKVHVRVDKVDTKDIPVDVNVTGTPADGCRAGKPSSPVSTITVQGPAAELANVAKAVAVIDVTGAESTLTNIECPVTLYDRDGTVVASQHITSKTEKIKVTVPMYNIDTLPLTVTLHGRGTAVQSMLDLLGIESNERRVVLTIADAEKTAALIAAQKRRLHIGVPGHGIVIAVPIKSVGGGNTVAYLNGGRSPKYTPDLSCAYELIIAIANEGGTDAVMNAARAAGARGGTVLHGKGTGAKGAPKFYNISIAAEKEVILIVSAAGQKAEIMRSILRKAGPDSDAGAIVFSLPASAVAGFGLLEEN